MKKLLIALFLVLSVVLSVPAFAWYDDYTSQDVANNGAGNMGSAGAIANSGNNNTIYGAGSSPVGTVEGGTGIGVGIGVGRADVDVKNKNTNVLFDINNIKNNANNTNTNTNNNYNWNANMISNKNQQQQVQGQQQGQLQGQGQMQNNKQVIAPNQVVTFESPVQLPNIGNGGNVPELNFGHGKMYDDTKRLPKFALFGITALGADDMISEVLVVNANVKFKNLYRSILSGAKDVANGGKKTLTDVRYQVIRAEAQKSWHTGGALGGGASGVGASGLAGGSAGASIVPSFGGTKADDLFTIFFLKVSK